jgi:hypothetical protein
MAALHPIVFFLPLFLGLGGGGVVPNDLAALIDVSDYFGPRQIEATPENLVKLSIKDPASAKESFVQLLAVRWLGEHADQLGARKDAARKALQQLAAGPDGFPRDYAERALARLNGGPLPLRTFGKDNIRKDALAWFPENVQMAGALDLRAAPAHKTIRAGDQAVVKQIKQIQAHLEKLLPNQAKDEVYIFAETVGNVRVDRISYGMAIDLAGPGQGQVYARATGRFNHKYLVEYLKQTVPNVTLDEKKGAQGEPITFISFEEPPILVLVGDTDVFVAGHANKKEGQAELAEQVLAVRDGKKPSMLTGALSQALKEVSPEATGLLIGEIPAIVHAELARTPIGSVPHHYALESGDGGADGGFLLRFRGEMGNDAGAKKFADGFKDLVKMGLDALKEAPPMPGMDILRLVLETIGGFELKADGTKISGALKVSADAQKNLIEKTAESLKKETGGM